MRRALAPLLAAGLLLVAACQPADRPPTATGAAAGQDFRFSYRTPAALGQAVAAGFDLYGVDAETRTAFGRASDETAGALARLGLRPQRIPAAQAGVRNTFDEGYRTYEQVASELAELARRHPDRLSLTSIGPSWETSQGNADRQIWAVRITGPGDASRRPAVAFTANLHARELVTVEVAMRLITMLVEGYDKDPAIRRLVDSRVVHVVPMANPDGHHKAEAGQNWRKNTHPYGRGTGVDLNRNFPFKWAAMNDPRGETYGGPAPVSEPETQAVKAFLAGIPNLALGMDYHAYSNLIMWSWGWTSSPPADAPLLETIGKKLASFNGYKPMQASGLYPTSGTIRDFVYGELHVPYFTTEMGSRMDGFDPPYSRVEKIWQENRPGALYLIGIADDPSQVLAGR